MSQPLALYQWTQCLANAFAVLSKPQRTTLALFSFGIAYACQCRLGRVARFLPFGGRADSLERRFQRFLGANSDMAKAQTALCRLVLSLLPSHQRLSVLVDETCLSDHLRFMVVAIAYQGRALPVCWQAYEPNKDRQQVQIILALLKRLKAARPTQPILVQADRGIGGSPALLKALAKLGFRYLMRVQKQVHLSRDGKTSHPFYTLKLTPGQTWSKRRKAFKKAGWLSCRAMAYWGEGHKEPWYLVTNCPQIAAQVYGQRMWEELAFRDLKSDGFDWQCSRVFAPSHAERLLLAMALATLALLSLGSHAEQSGKRAVLLTRTQQRRQSLFDLGMAFLHWCVWHPEALPDNWKLLNRPPPISKTVV